MRHREKSTGNLRIGGLSGPFFNGKCGVELSKMGGSVMFRDQDKWPVYCPMCGETTVKEIGWLKSTGLSCGACGAKLRYYQERMKRDLEDAQRAVKSFSRGLLVEK